MAWDMNNGTTGMKTITLRRDGQTKTHQFSEDTELGTAVRQIANEAGLTAVNVLHNGEEIGQEDAKLQLSRFDGNLSVVPKDSGSSN